MNNKEYTAALKIKNLHLLVSVLIIIPVGLVYGLNPFGLLTKLLHFPIDNINLSGMLKAVMGLYISIAGIWIAGIIKPTLWVTATWVNILCMGGLAFGRIISLITDGIPSYIFLLGLGLEIFLASWGIFNVKKYKLSDINSSIK